MKKRIVIMGGGTITHVRNHLALCAPAYGNTARKLGRMFEQELKAQGLADTHEVQVVLTKMADCSSRLETNDDVAQYVDALVADPSVKAVIFNVALADFQGRIGDEASGKYAERLRTKEGDVSMSLTPTEKLVGRFRKERKDLFLVAFKTTAGMSADVQYQRGLDLLKPNSVNLVLANDTVTRHNMIVAPEESRYCETTNREDVLQFLTKMTVSRMQNHFTRSTVVPAEPVQWNSSLVPQSLRDVVNYCIKHGAYKPLHGKTAGHFAVKVDEGEILTSIRKTNFNNLDSVGLVRVESKSDDEVIAYGARPSVGGQSQRIIFKEHPELDCIVHFHCPVKSDAKLKPRIPVKDQWPNECGSHECGRNTSRGLADIDLGGGHRLKVVFLDGHGPNIVFSRETPADKVMQFIDDNFALDQKTGGLVMSD